MRIVANSNFIAHGGHKILKAKTTWTGLHRIADKMSSSYGIALARGIKALKKQVSIEELIKLLEQGKPSLITSIIPWDKLDKLLDRSKELAKNNLIDSAKYSIDFMPRIIKPEIVFDKTNPRIEQYINTVIGTRIQNVKNESLSAIQRIIARSFNRGDTIRDIAHMIPRTIGLNERQADAVDNYRRGLKDKGLSDYKVDILTNRYYERLLDYRTTTIARTESIAAANQGQLEIWNQAIDKGLVEHGKAVKIWKTTPDDRLCEHCMALDGVTVGLNDKFDTDFGQIDAPSLHPNCYDKKTEVLTASRGWVYFRDLTIKDDMLTVNLETQQIEKSKIKNIVNYFSKNIVSFSNKFFDLMVTEDHNHVYRTYNLKTWRIINGKMLPKGAYFLNCPDPQKNNEPENYIIGDNKFKTIDFLAFLGIYLSEGNITKPKDSCWQIKISQQKYYKEMLEVTKKLFTEIWENKKEDAFYIPIKNNQALVKYFKQFGYSYEKYVPEDIKGFSSKYIKEFLKWYCLGDGTKRENKHFKNGNFEDSIYYHTSSDRMASDLGELILRIGKRVSYKKKPAQWCKHHNGIYLSRPMWVISELNSKTTTKVKRELKEYNDMVYCCEVEKNNTLIVRRNGKVCISGNCRCVLEFDIKS